MNSGGAPKEASGDSIVDALGHPCSNTFVNSPEAKGSGDGKLMCLSCSRELPGGLKSILPVRPFIKKSR